MQENNQDDPKKELAQMLMAVLGLIAVLALVDYIDAPIQQRIADDAARPEANAVWDARAQVWRYPDDLTIHYQAPAGQEL